MDPREESGVLRIVRWQDLYSRPMDLLQSNTNSYHGWEVLVSLLCCTQEKSRLHNCIIMQFIYLINIYLRSHAR